MSSSTTSNLNAALLNAPLLNAMLNHAILTETICRLVLIAGNSRRLWLDNYTYASEGDEETYDHWAFGFCDYDSAETLQLQACSCSRCGNYIVASQNKLCVQIKCRCPCVFDDEDEVDKIRFDKNTTNKLMNEYDAFDAFVMEMLPDQLITQDPVTQKISIFQDYPDRLCEDVIGEISRFLVV